MRLRFSEENCFSGGEESRERKNIVERWSVRNEPDHCGKVTLTQRHRTDRAPTHKLSSEASGMWHKPTCSDTHTHTQCSSGGSLGQ